MSSGIPSAHKVCYPATRPSRSVPMASMLKITRTEIKSFVPAQKLKHVLGPKSCATVLLTALLLVGLSGTFSSSARAQETRQNIFSNQKMDLSRMVVVGDSLSAGFENDSLWDVQQVHGWASVLADQAQVPLVLPLIASPGIPNHLELISATFPPVVAPVPGPASPGRDDPFVQPTDLAVPDPLLQDALTPQPSPPIDDFTDLILGLPGLEATPPLSLSQVQWAQTL